MEINSWVMSFFDSLYDGILIIDTDEIVKYVNQAYTNITKVRYSEIVGKRLREVRPGSRLHNVLLTRQPIAGALREEYGIQYTVNMSPIFEGTELIGAISVVGRIDDVYKLYQDIDKYKSKVKNLENRIKVIQKAKYGIDDIISKDVRFLEIKEVILKISKRNTDKKPKRANINFVMYDALGGGVTRSLALDKHGKSLSSYLLDIEIN